MIDMIKKLPLKKILSVFLLLMYVFAVLSISKIGKAAADIKVFQIVDAKVSEKSEAAIVDVNFNEKTVNTNFTFHKINDYIIYDLTFKNNDKKDYIIKGITDDNENPYVIYSYDQQKDKTIKAGGTIKIPVKISYDNEVTDLGKRHISDNVNFSFNIEDKDGNKLIANVPTNSRLIDNIIGWVILAIVLLIVIIILIVRNKKNKKAPTNALLLALLLVPITARAVDASFSFTVKANIKLHDKLAMKVVSNGKEQVVAIPYGEKPAVPETPKKKGYDFVGWYSEDKKYDFDTEVSDDIDLTAKYELNTYSIKYDYDGGLGTNPVKYNVESKSFTLKNPVKDGYTFAGWTGSNGKALQTRVTINKGTAGDLTFKANFSPRTDIPYTVIHKYKNFNGDGFDEEYVEKLVGATDSIVQPAPREVKGYANPTLKNLKVTLDGKATIEYIYERAMFTLAYNSNDVLSDKTPGSYKYGTQVTINAKEKQGYTFVKWGINAKGIPALIDNDNNGAISLGDEVVIGADWFYVVAPVQNGEVKLLSKLNINSSGRQAVDAGGADFGYRAYWADHNYNFHPFGNSSYWYVYTENYDMINNKYFLNKCAEEIIAYKKYLNSLGGVTVKEARLMSYEEIMEICGSNTTCPEYITERNFWLGSALMDGQVWNVKSYGVTTDYYTHGSGTRPLIVINESDVSLLNESNALATFTIDTNTTVTAIYRPNKNTPYTVLHKKQDMDDESLYTLAKTENKTGATGELVRPATVNTYGNDYTIPTAQNVYIAGDGSTVVEYLYDYKYYNITLDPNGGYSNTESVKIVKGEQTSFTTPIKDHALFLGWYTDPDDGTLVAGVNESFTPTKSQILYAHWEEDSSVNTAYLDDSDNSGTVSYGDRVVIGYDEFYYVGKDESGNFKLLTKLPLDNNYRQSTTPNTRYSFVSGRSYWLSPASSSSSTQNFEFNVDKYGYKYVYRDSNNEDMETGLTYSVNHYGSYISSTYNINVIDSRVMSYAEAFDIGCSETSCPAYMTDYSFYLGSICDGSINCDVYHNDIWGVSNYYGGLHEVHSYSSEIQNGVGNPPLDIIRIRPMIIVPKSEIVLPWDNTGNQPRLMDSNHDGQVSVGDQVVIGDDQFRFIGKDSNGNFKLLASYNLDSNYRQSEYNNIALDFADTNYWEYLYAASSSGETGSNDECNDFYCEVYSSDSYGITRYIYRNSNNEDIAENNLTSYVNNYRNYINNTYGVDVVDARLMSYKEANSIGCGSDSDSTATCSNYFSNQSYWLGSSSTSKSIIIISSDHHASYEIYYSVNVVYDPDYYEALKIGARPVIIVYASDVDLPDGVQLD